MAAAGHFVENLQSNKEQMYKELRQFLSDTNLDVITAEAIIWITFLMYQFWQADKKKDHEIYERIGNLTFSTANRLALGMIESQTGFDFTERAFESRKLYFQSMKDGSRQLPLVESFATVLLRSVGCRTLAEPPKTITRPPLELEWGLINIVVSIFFSTMPLGYYDTFKNMLRDRPDLFPDDEENFDD
jgi:hypothetical protein